MSDAQTLAVRSVARGAVLFSKKQLERSMEYVIAACSLGALLVCLTVIGMIRGYDVEVTFHPPIFFKLKVTRPRQP